MDKNVNIFMGLSNIAGYFTKIKVGFDELGINSYLLDVGVDTFSYGNATKDNIYISFLIYSYSFRFQYKNIILKLFFVLIYKILLIPIFLWSLFKFDVFIFAFNHSFFRLLDLPILKLLNKKIIFVYLGSDSRPPYMSGIDIFINQRSILDLVLRAKKIKDRIVYVEKYADLIIDNPASGQFHEKDFINWMCIGMPTLVDEFYTETLSSTKKDETRIVHAPSRPITKGSAIFDEIIKKLQLKYNIIYIKLINKSNLEVLEELKKCDFVIDELYSDIPIGGLSSEAAAYKKISIVSGYYNEEIKKDVIAKYLPPSQYGNPSDIEQDIINLIENKNKASSGEEIFNYILENWSSKVIAKKFLMLIDDNYPSEWIYDTCSNEYIYGYGISKEELKKQYLKIYNEFGIDAFQLGHNLKLKSKILDFIHD